MSALVLTPNADLVMSSHAANARAALSSPSAADAAARSGQFRLTRRGRVVLGALATALVAACLALFASIGAPQALASDTTAGAQQFHYVVAQPGASLWSLASELDPTADPRDLVAELVQLNQLEGAGVQAGEAIAVPLRYSDNAGVVSADELN